MTEADARAALGERVRLRREAMGLSIDQAAHQADRMSATTWSRVEAGKSVRRLTYAAVDKTLRWRVASCTRFLAERIEPEPEPALIVIPRPEAPTVRELIAAAHEDLDAIEEELDRRLRQARKSPQEMALVLATLREIQDAERESG